jgi:hypothetical protein
VTLRYEPEVRDFILDTSDSLTLSRSLTRYFRGVAQSCQVDADNERMPETHRERASAIAAFCNDTVSRWGHPEEKA